MMMYQFSFYATEKALSYRIIPAVAFIAHALLDMMLLQYIPMTT
jgi:hypothetical protein